MPNFNGELRMASFVWFFFFFFDLRNATTINSVEYQFLNVFFSFDLTLFFFDLAAISLISLFGITCKYSNFSSWAIFEVHDFEKKK